MALDAQALEGEGGRAQYRSRRSRRRGCGPRRLFAARQNSQDYFGGFRPLRSRLSCCDLKGAILRRSRSFTRFFVDFRKMDERTVDRWGSSSAEQRYEMASLSD